MPKIQKGRLILLFGVLFAVIGVFCFSGKTLATHAAGSNAYFMLSPSTGAFSIDSTFNVTIFINTGGETINAFKAKIYFPADKLQVVSSGVGQSITGFWVNRPLFSNEKGYIELQGAIPNPGITTDSGVLATITFRAKALGRAIVYFADDAALYLNDSNGTELATDKKNAVFDLTLPPPQGPIVVSPTHPDQSKWYRINDAILSWESQFPVSGYSFVLNKSPIDLPDTTSEGRETSTIYKKLDDGIWYFHVRSLRDGVWGGVTHFGIKVQTSSPAEFPIDVSPGKRTSSKTVILSFETSDPLSGISHYEAKVIPLQPRNSSTEKPQMEETFFFELTSPFVLTLGDYGNYDVVVRAYNHAGGFTESALKLAIVRPLFRFIASDGLIVGDLFTIPWWAFWLLVLILIVILAYAAFHTFQWHLRISFRHKKGALGEETVNDKLQELQSRFRSLKSVLILALGIGILLSAQIGTIHAAAGFSAPITTIVSRNITNNELFYIGGQAGAGSGSKVIVYLQSLFDGQTFSFEAPVSPQGEWFYSHPTFLQSGEYRVWTQLKLGDETSPPSGEIKLSVSSAALQVGASRLSYETIYLFLLVVAVAVILGLAAFAGYHFYHGRRKYHHLRKEIREAEESIRRGFAVLRRDIQAELDGIKRLKMSKELANQERAREEQLMKDLNEINEYIGKEVWDIEHVLDTEGD